MPQFETRENSHSTVMSSVDNTAEKLLADTRPERSGRGAALLAGGLVGAGIAFAHNQGEQMIAMGAWEPSSYLWRSSSGAIEHLAPFKDKVSLTGGYRAHVLDELNLLRNQREMAYAGVEEVLAKSEALLSKNPKLMLQATKQELINSGAVASMEKLSSSVAEGTLLPGADSTLKLLRYAHTSGEAATVMDQFFKADGEKLLADTALKNSREGLLAALRNDTAACVTRGFAKGALAATAIVGVGALTDTLMGKDPQLSATQLMLDGVVAPAVLLSALPARYRIAMAGTAFGLSRLAGVMR